MATVNNNLSDYDIHSVPNASAMTFGIVVSEWNEKITKGLLKGAYNTLVKHGVKEENIITRFIPGAFELPLAAQTMYEQINLDAVICLGSVIQGETKHFDFVCEGTAIGIKDVALKYNKPTIFGVLTDNNEQQAIDRSGGKHGNKGDEAAVTAIKMVDFQKSFK
jgi:6,7-dimethyl-8-ribityllumazine synthase